MILKVQDLLLRLRLSRFCERAPVVPLLTVRLLDRPFSLGTLHRPSSLPVFAPVVVKTLQSFPSVLQ